VIHYDYILPCIIGLPIISTSIKPSHYSVNVIKQQIFFNNKTAPTSYDPTQLISRVTSNTNISTRGPNSYSQACTSYYIRIWVYTYSSCNCLTILSTIFI